MKPNNIKSGKVYLITNLLNQKKYVGITTVSLSLRFKQHLYCSTHDNPSYAFHRAIKKYGVENFKFELIELLYNVSEKELLNRESYYIHKFNTFINNKNGYNMTTHSNNKLIFSDITRRKMSLNTQGTGNPFYGKPHTSDSIIKMINTFKLNYKKENHPFYNKSHSNYTKNKIKKSKLGQVHTSTTKTKMSNSHKGIKFTKLHCENLSDALSYTYEILFDNGNILTVNGLHKFANENGYSQGNLYGVYKGTRKKHKNVIGVKLLPTGV